MDTKTFPHLSFNFPLRWGSEIFLVDGFYGNVKAINFFTCLYTVYICLSLKQGQPYRFIINNLIHGFGAKLLLSVKVHIL